VYPKDTNFQNFEKVGSKDSDIAEILFCGLNDCLTYSEISFKKSDAQVGRVNTFQYCELYVKDLQPSGFVWKDP
jgi:hypothetical protein